MRPLLALALIGCGAATTRTNLVTYPDGKLRFEFELRDGIPNGRGRAFHPNGKLASEGTYKDGARSGRFTFYNEDGSFAAQAVYVDNAEVWRSADEHAVSDIPEPIIAEEPHLALQPYFATLDRTTTPARAGAQFGVGGAHDLGFGAATRLDVFGNYRFGRYGVFAQFTETRLALDNDMSLGGRRAAIVAGTDQFELGPAVLSTTLGFIAALGNADAAGSVASYAGAEQRPSDAAIAIPAPFGLRSSASLTATRGQFVAQADVGIDWLLGGDQQAFDPLARANLGIGYGKRDAMLMAELDNSFHLASSQAQFHAVALGGTLRFPFMWVSGSLALSFEGTLSLLSTVGRDL